MEAERIDGECRRGQQRKAHFNYLKELRTQKIQAASKTVEISSSSTISLPRPPADHPSMPGAAGRRVSPSRSPPLMALSSAGYSLELGWETGRTPPRPSQSIRVLLPL